MNLFKTYVLSASIALALTAGTAIATETDKSVPPDNSAKNSRDVQKGPLTPEDQSSDKADVDLTAKVRQAVVKDDSLSVNAKNVKIITVGGVVTLRGPVESQAEKDSIGTKATQIAGNGNVKNQIEVKAN